MYFSNASSSFIPNWMSLDYLREKSAEHEFYILDKQAKSQVLAVTWLPLHSSAPVSFQWV